MNPCPKKCNQCYVCWLYYFNPRYSKIWNRTETEIPKHLERYGPESIIKQKKNKFDKKSSTITIQKKPQIDRPNRCEHLLKRIEFKAGCNGFYCQHSCKLNLPAVPGKFCQICDKYENSEEGF